MTRVALAKWGNNLALRLPKATVKAMGVAEGSEVAIKVAKGTLVATPLGRKPKLDELIKTISTRNRHEAIDWGKPVGREVW
jgi:antitoxin MazE